MNALRVKRRGWRSAAGALLFSFAALNGGCTTTECLLYACANRATLDGNVMIAEQVTAADFRLCVGTAAASGISATTNVLASGCKEGSLNLTELDGGLPCPTWGPGVQVCLAKTSAPETFTLNAVWQLGDSEIPHDIAMRLTLIDHVSGGVLLDETRTAKAGTPHSDSCHLCWNAEATL